MDVEGNGLVRWLHLRVGGVTVGSFCVFPGSQPYETLRTGISRDLLAHASALAVCRDDVAEVAVLDELYNARVAHRLKAGRDEEAATLTEERRRIVAETARGVLQRIRQRRGAIASNTTDQLERFAPQWAELTSTLDKLIHPPERNPD